MKKQYLWALAMMFIAALPLWIGACRFGARRGPLCGSFYRNGRGGAEPEWKQLSGCHRTFRDGAALAGYP